MANIFYRIYEFERWRKEYLRTIKRENKILKSTNKLLKELLNKDVHS